MVQYTTPLEQVKLIPGQADSLTGIEHVFMHIWAAIPSAGASQVGVCVFLDRCWFAGCDPRGEEEVTRQRGLKAVSKG